MPFGIFPSQRGRRSGIIIPGYGESSRGRYLTHLGYYWAPSDYFDLRSAADLTETQGIILRNRLRYGVRYLLQGNVDFSYNYRRATSGAPAQTRTELRFNHSQQIDPSLRVVAQGNFSSSQFKQNLSQNLPDRLERVLRSHLNFSKRFENGSNLSGTLSQTRFLDRGSIETQFPTLNFRVPRRPLFGADREESSLGSGSGFGFSFGAEDEGPELPDWRENFYIDYGVQLISRSEKIEAPNPDTTSWGSRSQGGLEQRANLTYSGKAFGWLNLQPTLNVRESWYFGDSVPDSLGGFQRRLLWTSSLRASTKLYGIAEQPFGIGASFRHVVEPSLSLNYQPDFTELPDVPTLFGGNPGPQRSLSFGLNQIFQMKRQVGEQERKTDLARINTRGSYNAEARGRKLSDISSSLNMNPGRVLSLQLNASHRFYDEADQFQWTPTLLRANLRSSLRLDSAMLGSLLGIGVRSASAAETEEEDPEGAETAQAQEQEQPEQPFGSPTAESDRLIDRRQPARAGRLWSLTLGHDYGWARGLGGAEDDRTHSLDGSLTFNLPKTTFTLTARYDFVRKEMVRQTLTIHRDLHCWEARLQVVPTGPGRGYWFVIGVKEIPEIKYERRRTIFGR